MVMLCCWNCEVDPATVAPKWLSGHCNEDLEGKWLCPKLLDGPGQVEKRLPSRLPGQWVRGWSTNITFSAAQQCSAPRCGWCKSYIARRGSSWKAGWYMVWCNCYFDMVLLRSTWVELENFGATGCQAPRMSSRKATMMLQSHLYSLFLEAWHKNLWKNMKESRSKLSHIFLWHGLAVTQMYCHGP